MSAPTQDDIKIVIPGWVSHGGPVYSLDISGDNARFVTAGYDSLVKIWNARALDLPEEEAKGDYLLCTLTSHMNAVNAVKFAPMPSAADAFYTKQTTPLLASASDDKSVMLWEHKADQEPVTVFGSKVKNQETWECICVLRGHSADVHDLAWSPRGDRIASCSIDNSVIVWDVQKKCMLHQLGGHDGWIQGVAWDPLDMYLATQGGDGTFIIWNLADWSQVTKITEGFESVSMLKQNSNMYRQTCFSRLSWAPDGSFVCASRGTARQKSTSSNGSETGERDRIVWVSPVYERGSWECKIRFIGHRKATTVTRFCPVLFKGKDNTTFTVCSVGSMDNTMTLWTSLEKKPFLLMKHFFTQSYLDIAWGSDGTRLMACSHDGKIMYLRFGDSVMPGKRLSRTEQEQLIRPQRQLLSDLPESFDALQTTDSLDTTEDTALVETKTSPLKMGPNQGQGKLVSTPLVRRKQSNPATAVAAMNVINVQKVTVDKKGRKRIAPVAMDSPTQPAATGLHNRLGFPNNATNTQPMFNAVQTMSGFPGATSTERVVEKVATVHQETIVQISSPPLILSPPQTGNMLTCFVPVEDQTPGISHATDEKNTRKRAFSADVRRRGNSDLQGSLAYDKASHFESRVRATLNTELLWTSSLPGKITHVGCTRSFCIAVSRPCAPIPQEQKQPAGSKNKKRRATLEASEGSLLHVFGRLGRRVLPCLVLESLVYSIAVASDDFLLLALCTGEIKVYDLSIPRLVMCANMQGLFATRPRSVSVAKIRLNKGKNNSVQPVVTLSDGNIFAYAEALQGWSLVRDVSLWGSQFNSAWKNDKASSSSQALPRGIELATSSTETSVIDIEQTSIARLAKEAPVPTVSWQHSNKLSRTAELAQTLANIECNMYGAELIQSAEEYEYWCVTYVTKLTAQLSTSPTNIELIKAFFEHLFQKGQDLTRAQLEEEDATMDLEDSCFTAVGLLTRLIGKLMAIISKQPSRGMQRLRVRLKESLSVLESYHR